MRSNKNPFGTDQSDEKNSNCISFCFTCKFHANRVSSVQSRVIKVCTDALALALRGSRLA